MKKKRRMTKEQLMNLRLGRMMLHDPMGFLALQEWLQMQDDKIFLVETGVHMREVPDEDR